jgi:hypothetical protein
MPGPLHPSLAVLLPLLYYYAVSYVPVTSAQGFYNRCAHNWAAALNGWPQFMAAACPDAGGATHVSELDLNDCLANAEGTLVGQKS